MAIDPENFSKFTENLSNIAESAPMSDDKTKDIIDTAIGTAISDMEELINESRSPKLYVWVDPGSANPH